MVERYHGRQSEHLDPTQSANSGAHVDRIQAEPADERSPPATGNECVRQPGNSSHRQLVAQPTTGRSRTWALKVEHQGTP
jgi:hypothetical protein